MAGSLPKGAPADFYREIIQALHNKGVKTLIDHHGSALLHTLPEQPEIVKMNQEEFLETFKTEARSLDEWVAVCLKQMKKNAIDTLIITCGKEGILAFTPQGYISLVAAR